MGDHYSGYYYLIYLRYFREYCSMPAFVTFKDPIDYLLALLVNDESFRIVHNYVERNSSII